MYQPCQEISSRVVIKNLHSSIPVTNIKDELEKNSFEIRSVTNIRSWKTKEPFALFFVGQAPGERNKEIYELL